MKVVQIITRMDTIGGAQVHVRDLVMEMTRNGHEVVVLTGGKSHVFHVLEDEGVEVLFITHMQRELKLIQDVKGFFEMRSQLKKLRPEIVAVHSSKAGILGRVAAWSLSIPVVFTAHGWSFTEGVSLRKRRFYEIIERIIGKLTTNIITVSNYDRALAFNRGVISNEKMQTIHNGVQKVETDNLYAKPAHHPPTIVMVARFEKPKQQLLLIRYLERLKHFDWQLQFVGDGQFLQEAKSLVSSMQLVDRVHFLQARNDVDEILSKSQIFVLLSEWEGFPLSILEAMRAGLPIVASHVGGVSEAITDGENGFLIRNSEEEFIEKMTLLLQNEQLREAMGKKSQKKWTTHFTFEHMYNKTLCVYEEALKK